MDTGDNPDSHKNVIISIWSIYSDPWNFHAKSFCGFCVKLTSHKQKMYDNIHQLLGMSNDVYVT